MLPNVINIRSLHARVAQKCYEAVKSTGVHAGLKDEFHVKALQPRSSY